MLSLIAVGQPEQIIGRNTIKFANFHDKFDWGLSGSMLIVGVGLKRNRQCSGYLF